MRAAESRDLTEAQAAGTCLSAAALAARDPAALVGRSRGGRRRGPGDPAVAAVAEQLAWGAGATASCWEREDKRKPRNV